MKMKNLTAAISVAVLPCFSALADLEALWWAVPEDVTITRGTQTYGSLTELREAYGIEEYSTETDSGGLFARIVAVDGSGNTSYMKQWSGSEFIDDDWMLLVPNDSDDDNRNGWYAAVAGYEEYSFYVELGNWEGSDESPTWTSYGQSTDVVAYDRLKDDAKIQKFVNGSLINPAHPWTPMSYVVPEPTSGLLLVFGASGLALRRRRNFSRG